MKFGLKDPEYQFLYDHLIEPLKKRGAQVYIFGSRASGKHRPFSDIDLLYKISISAPISGSDIFNLLSFMEDSNFPYKIDLVNSDELAESFRERVEKEKIEL